MNPTEQPAPDDLLPANEAVRLIPGKRRGKSRHISTLYRFVKRGWLTGYYVGGLLFVSAAEARNFVRVRQPAGPQGSGLGMTRAQQAKVTREVLERHGLA